MINLTKNDLEFLNLVYVKYKELNPKLNLKFNAWIISLAINGLLED